MRPRHTTALIAAAALGIAAVPAVSPDTAPVARAQLVIPLPVGLSPLGYIPPEAIALGLAVAGIALPVLSSRLGDSGSLSGLGQAGSTELSGISENVVTPVDYKAEAKKMLALINDERRAIGVPELLWDEAEYEEAMAWTRPIGLDPDKYGHNTAGYYYWHFGEDLAMGPSSEVMVQAWLGEKSNEPGKRGHYDSLMYPDHRYAAIAVVPSPRGLVATALLASFEGPAPTTW